MGSFAAGVIWALIVIATLGWVFNAGQEHACQHVEHVCAEAK